MARKYCLPISRTAAEAAAPARLAEEHGGRALWRVRPDAVLEVATEKDGWLYRYEVYEDGTTMLIDKAPPPPGYRWGAPVACGALIVFIVAMIAGAADPEDLLSPGHSFPLFVAGMAVMVIGSIPAIYAGSIDTRVRHLSSRTSAWHEATKLNGWVPQTSVQLAAVELLADDHGGVAKVRDAGGPTVDVLVGSWGRRLRYSVDVSGCTERVEATRQSNKVLAAEAVEVRTREEESGD